MKRFFLIALSALLLSCVGDDPTPAPLPTPQPGTPQRSVKRGLCFNFDDTGDVMLLAGGISWCYNWGEQEDDATAQMLKAYKVEFVPMAWNGGFNEDRIRAWKQSHPSCRYVLAFNEPNLTDQARMTPQQAAAEWPRLRQLAKELDLKIVAPAMNYGTLPGYSDPVKWLDEFFALVPKKDVVALSLHCYMGSAGAMKSFLDRFDKYKLPLWLTEFCGWEESIGSVESQMGYMCSAVTYLESDPRVDRYAWFIARGDKPVTTYPYMQLLTRVYPSSLTPLGKIYMSLPAANAPLLQSATTPLNLNYFIDSHASEAARQKTIMNAVQLRVSTDTEAPSAGMMIRTLMDNQWVKYAVAADADCSMLTVRYACVADAVLKVEVDDAKAIYVMLPASTGWATASQALTLPAGQHNLKVSMYSGYCDLSTLYFL